jgi:CheY-like chemotaxis protein
MAAMLLDSHLDGEQAIHARRIKALAEDLSGRLAPPLPMVERAPQGRRRALLAEDDEINGLFAQEALEGAGAEVDWVRNGEDALAAVEASLMGRRPAYDLVCLDIRMPGLSGLDVARRIRALEAARAYEPPLRIVALTATAMRQDRLAAKAAGFSDFVSKPYRADALAELLSAAPVRLAKAS